MKRAMFIKRVKMGVGNAGGDALQYRLSDPMYFEAGDERHKTHDVVVSSVITHNGEKQSFIFPSDRDGNILSMKELEGSVTGSLDHEKALERAGYEVI